jgi:hypothetical protein
VNGQPKIIWHPEHATLMMQSNFLSQEYRPGFFQGLSQAQLLSRAAPVAVLFGVKSAVEHMLTKDTTKTPLVAISIIASAVGGGFLGALRALLPSSMHSSGSSIIGREMAGATLYFTTYAGVKNLFMLKKTDPKDDNSLNPLATMTAGAVAGLMYDGVRSSSQFTNLETPLTRVQTRSIMHFLMRSAPSHALLFLGYEATLRLFSSGKAC